MKERSHEMKCLRSRVRYFGVFLKSLRFVLVEKPDTAASSSRIQSLPGKRILWRTISAIMQPTAQISTTYAQRKKEGKDSKQQNATSQQKEIGPMFFGQEV